MTRRHIPDPQLTIYEAEQLVFAAGYWIECALPDGDASGETPHEAQAKVRAVEKIRRALEAG